MKPEELENELRLMRAIQVELLMQLLEERAELRALAQALEERLNDSPNQSLQWKEAWQATKASEFQLLCKQLLQREPSVGELLRRFLQ